jgi:hypothetical protein
MSGARPLLVSAELVGLLHGPARVFAESLPTTSTAENDVAFFAPSAPLSLAVGAGQGLDEKGEKQCSG